MLSKQSDVGQASSLFASRVSRMLRIEWIGQTTASLCWIISVFAYGLSEPGDYLQLSAASAWLIANIASVAITRDHRTT